jgi:glycosyltransferase involved in cell wall biosynthesis
MIEGLKVVTVLPAYQAARTLERTLAEIPHDIVDDIVLVDDASRDDTVAIARKLGLRTIVHEHNLGYGGNQKTCYREALALGADIVVMLHPDYQYTPRLLGAMAHMIASGHYEVVLGSRILAQSAVAGGMPVYKYISNRALTLAQNLIMGQKLSEYHTGYRAFARPVLEGLDLASFSNDFVFDNQMLCSAIQHGFRVGELSCPTRYNDDASSISFRRSVTYGVGVLRTAWAYARWRPRAAGLGPEASSANVKAGSPAPAARASASA